jgi:hypothetical protein
MECLSGKQHERSRARALRSFPAAGDRTACHAGHPAASARVAIYRWNARFDATLISKVNGDLTIAHQYLARILEKTGVQMRALGLSARFAMWRELIRCRRGRPARNLAQGDRSRLSLFDGRSGKIFASSPAFPGRPKGDWPIIKSALSGKSPVSGHRHLQQ